MSKLFNQLKSMKSIKIFHIVIILALLAAFISSAALPPASQGVKAYAQQANELTYVTDQVRLLGEEISSNPLEIICNVEAILLPVPPILRKPAGYAWGG